MPVVECDVDVAREKLERAGAEIEPGNTEHELWRATRGDAVAVAYDGKVVVQGKRPTDVTAVLADAGGRSSADGDDGPEDAGGRVHVYFDGASRGNPGPAAVGWVLVDGDGIVAEGGERIGRATNNQAEYAALLRGLEVARDMGYGDAEIRGDSQLVVKQVKGAWNTNDPVLKERRVRARELLAGFDDWTITHVPREVNDRADDLANEALDDA